MAAVILVPLRADGGQRDRLWAFVRAHIESEIALPIYEGLHDEGPFNRSAALNRAAEAAEPWDVAVVLDADVLVGAAQIREAVDRAVRFDCMAFAFVDFRALTKAGTESVLEGYRGSWAPFVKWTKHHAASSCLAVSRATWDAVGGFDERFQGWGWEDVAFSLACRVITGRYERVAGDAWHLHHARSQWRDPENFNYQAAEALGARYKAARRDPDAMRAVLAEQRT